MHIYGKYFIAILHLPLLHTSEICMLEHQLEMLNTMSELYHRREKFLISLKKDLAPFPDNQKIAFTGIDDNHTQESTEMIIIALQHVGLFFRLTLIIPKNDDPYRQILTYQPNSLQHEHAWPILDDKVAHRAPSEILGEFSSIVRSQKPIPRNQSFSDQNKDKLREMVLSYTIYLMPFKNDIPIIMFLLIEALQKDNNFRNNIYKIEFCIHEPEQSIHNKELLLPTIALYIAAKEGAAQASLNKLCSIFRDFSGINVAPAWSERVNSLIFWSQGPQESKSFLKNKYLFEPGTPEGKDRVCYRDDLTGKKVDYHLKHTACASK